MAGPTPSEYKLVFISWFDAETEHGWTLIEDAISAPILPCHTIGWLIHQDDEKVIVAHTISEDGRQVNGVIAIPSIWIEGEIKPVEHGEDNVIRLTPA